MKPTRLFFCTDRLLLRPKETWKVGVIIAYQGPGKRWGNRHEQGGRFDGTVRSAMSERSCEVEDHRRGHTRVGLTAGAAIAKADLAPRGSPGFRVTARVVSSASGRAGGGLQCRADGGEKFDGYCGHRRVGFISSADKDLSASQKGPSVRHSFHGDALSLPPANCRLICDLVIIISSVTCFVICETLSTCTPLQQIGPVG